MILIYVDESGDTGTNFHDPQQPVFVLGALAIKQDEWKVIEQGYYSIVKKYFNDEIPQNFELHTTDLVSCRGSFKSFNLVDTQRFRNEIFSFIVSQKIPVFYRKIDKKLYLKYCEARYGKGLKIEPYIMAFPFVGLAINDYLKKQNDLGIFIFDEHRSLADIELSLKTLRGTEAPLLNLDHVIEKGFFIDSSQSVPLQLIDFILYYTRKREEHLLGKKVSPIHQEVFVAIESICINLDKDARGKDILDWVDSRIKK